MVAWKRAKKVDNEKLGEILGTKTRLKFSRTFSRLQFGSGISEKTVFKIVLLAAFFVLFARRIVKSLIDSGQG